MYSTDKNIGFSTLLLVEKYFLQYQTALWRTLCAPILPFPFPCLCSAHFLFALLFHSLHIVFICTTAQPITAGLEWCISCLIAHPVCHHRWSGILVFGAEERKLFFFFFNAGLLTSLPPTSPLSHTLSISHSVLHTHTHTQSHTLIRGIVASVPRSCQPPRAPFPLDHMCPFSMVQW